MSKYAYNANRNNINAIKQSDGSTVAANGQGAPATFGVTLASGTVYVFPIGGDDSPVGSETMVVTIHLRWDNAIAFSAQVEECCFPAAFPDNTSTVADVANHDTTVGNWILIRPSTAYVEVAGGGTYTVGTGIVAVTAGQQGGTTITLKDWGARRGRIKLTTAGSGGLVRCAIHGKAAA